MAQATTQARRTGVISLIVDNTSGVLARITSLFCRRGFNINSLSVSETEDPKISRITVTVYGTDIELRQAILHTGRLEEVRYAFELDEEDSIKRELLLVKVAADVDNRAELHEISNIYNAKILDLSPDSMVFELTGEPAKVEAFVGMMRGYRILEMCRTGITAMDRGGQWLHGAKPVQERRDI